MKWFVLTLFLTALVADLYIYRSLIRLRFHSLSAHIAYMVLALITDGAAFAALVLYGAAADRGSAGVTAVMWLVWLFFLALAPKLFYALGGVLDLVTGLIVREKVSIFRWIVLAPASAVVVAMIHGATTGRTQLRVEEVEVVSERVPAAFDGYRIVQFSDVHVGTMLNPEKQIAAMTEKITSLEGDMVVHTGDLVNLTHEELTPEVMEALGRIDAPEGVWSVWGNHDLGFYIKEGTEPTPAENLESMSEKIRAMGWRVLSDRSVWIRRGADSLLLTGLDYPTTRLNGHNNELGGTDYDAAFASAAGSDPFNVVLSHTPVIWDEITSRGRGDVTLSGHIHSMQTKLRLFGRLWSPAQYMYKEWSGKYFIKKVKNHTQYINDGIGCVGYPMRIGAKGEITVLTLKRCE